MNRHLICSAELRQISETLQELYTPVPREQFLDHALRLVNRIFPDAVCSCELLELSTGQVDSRLQVAGDPVIQTEFGQNMNKLIGMYLHQNPIVQYLANGGNKSVLKLSDFTTYREFGKTELYQEVFRELGVKHQIAMGLHGLPGKVGGMTINIPGKNDFSGGEEALLEILQPHIVQALSNSILFSELSDAKRTAPLNPASLAKKGITKREAEVLEWIVQGKKDSEIGIILGISSRTVQVHVGRILSKLGVETRTAAINAIIRG